MLEPFNFDSGPLRCGTHDLEPLADRFGTPLYVYAAEGLTGRYESLARAFAPLNPTVHFAAKACSNVHILKIAVGMGAGIDVVSGGELERAWLAGCPMDKIVFAGVGKTEEEITAALDGSRSLLAGSDTPAAFGRPDPAGRGPVGLFNIESEQEYARIDSIARELGVEARATLRVNPNVDAGTHEYTTTGKSENKFGIELEPAESLYKSCSGVPGLTLVGLHCHLGSPIHEVEPYVTAAHVLIDMAERIRTAGKPVDVLNIGGGWGTPYRTGENRPIERYADALVPILKPEADRGTRILLEPGRSLVANAAMLLTRVQYIKRGKTKRFLVCDAGMHSLLRPALYKAFHFIWPVAGPVPDRIDQDPGIQGCEPADVVGPICESGDFLAKDRPLPESIAQGDLLAVFSAGAYGMSMASNYNDHERPAEVLIERDAVRLIRRRQEPVDLLKHELPDHLTD